jgi:hypothetical protein
MSYLTTWWSWVIRIRMGTTQWHLIWLSEHPMCLFRKGAVCVWHRTTGASCLTGDVWIASQIAKIGSSIGILLLGWVVERWDKKIIILLYSPSVAINVTYIPSETSTPSTWIFIPISSMPPSKSFSLQPIPFARSSKCKPVGSAHNLIFSLRLSLDHLSVRNPCIRFPPSLLLPLPSISVSWSIGPARVASEPNFLGDILPYRLGMSFAHTLDTCHSCFASCPGRYKEYVERHCWFRVSTWR